MSSPAANPQPLLVVQVGADLKQRLRQAAERNGDTTLSPTVRRLLAKALREDERLAAAAPAGR